MTTNADTNPAHSSATLAHSVPTRTYRHACPEPPQAYISGFYAYDAPAPLAARFGVVVWDGRGSLNEYVYPVYLTHTGRLIVRQTGRHNILPRGMRQAIRREANSRMRNK